MAISYPAALDNFTNPVGTDNLGSGTVPHATQHANLNDAVEALEVAVGIAASTDPNSLVYKVENALFPTGLTIGGQTGVGIKLDTVGETFGWHDILGHINSRGSGAADPTFNIYTGTVMRCYEFSASVEQEIFIVFHIPHDYVPSTDIFLHSHWSNAAAVPNTGNVVWGFDYSYSKGFNQEAFPAFQTVLVTQACPAQRYRHNVAETVAITIPTLMEPDGIILCRGYRKAADAADTCTDAVFLHTMDVHYQSTNLATKNKAPNFYAVP